MKASILGIAIIGIALVAGISAYHYQTQGIASGSEAGQAYAIDNSATSEENTLL